jgi:hypothetical protein
MRILQLGVVFEVHQLHGNGPVSYEVIEYPGALTTPAVLDCTVAGQVSGGRGWRTWTRLFHVLCQHYRSACDVL